jgi:hypothetical protein
LNSINFPSYSVRSQWLEMTASGYFRFGCGALQ